MVSGGTGVGNPGTGSSYNTWICGVVKSSTFVEIYICNTVQTAGPPYSTLTYMDRRAQSALQKRDIGASQIRFEPEIFLRDIFFCTQFSENFTECLVVFFYHSGAQSRGRAY